MKTATFRLVLGAAAGVWIGAGVAFGTCAGDSGVAGEWIFEPEADVPGWAVNSGGDGDWGNLGLTGGAGFSTNVPGVNCGCGHSLELPGTNGAAGAVSVGSYDPLAGAEKFSVMGWVRRESAPGENLSARIFSDADSTALADTTAGVEFRFSGSAGNLALRINGTEVATTVGGVAPESGEWHHVAAVYDGTRAATNYATRNVHFYVDGVQKGVGSVLQGVVVASNDAPVVVGNASAARTAGNLLVGNVDDVLVIPGWAPEPAGNGNASEAIQCFMAWADDIFPPGISAPGDVEAEAGECLEPVAVELGSPAAWDDCGVAGVANDAPETFGVGETTVTWTATDVAGNTASAVQTVTVFPSATGDCDGDGLTDWEEEMEWGTDATLRDTDGDGWGDGEEAAAGFDPLDAGNAPKVTIHAAYYNPSGTDAGKEWIELYSASVADVELGGFRLEVGRTTGWESVLVLPGNTILAPGHRLLIGESAVTNADLTATLDIPNAWTNEPTTGLRLVRGNAQDTFVLDAVFIGGGAVFNETDLDATGWTSTNSVWAHAGTILERRFPGVDTDHQRDWNEVQHRSPINSTGDLDFDGDGLSDGAEWSGCDNPWHEPTNPWIGDSDGDGLTDFEECTIYGTNPNTWASDGDIYAWMPRGTPATNWPGCDSYEVKHGCNPLVPDENVNGIPDSWEMALGLANLDGLTDNDGDGLDNLSELFQNSNPNDGDDSSGRDFVVFFETTVPNWSNKAIDNDIGLGGVVNVRFLGLQTPRRICVLVGEGNVPEPFSLKWFGATAAVGEGHDYVEFAATSALADEYSWLKISDAGLRPEYEETLGGEYQIDLLVLDLTICNGGYDLENGKSTGVCGEVVAETDEETVGAYVLVNWDDDDGDGKMNSNGTWTQQPEPDLAENYVEGEDNLAPLKLSLTPLPQKGKAELEVSGPDAESIKLWTQSEKGTEIQLDCGRKTWDLSVSSDRNELVSIIKDGCWIEGVAPGTVERGVSLQFRYKNPEGMTLCEDCCKTTVVMIRLGNVVYRELLVAGMRERCHAGIVYSFAALVSHDSLTNSFNYGIMQMPRLNPAAERLSGITINGNAEYWYCYTAPEMLTDDIAGYRKRLKILMIADWAGTDWQNHYCKFNCLEPNGTNWDGTLTDVAALRCDGLVELAYEINDIMVWGRIVNGSEPHYDMRNNIYLQEHNEWKWGDDPEDWDDDMYATMLPITQGGFADDYISEHRPNYHGDTFRGHLWDTRFQEQRLVQPEVLSPERHVH